MKTTIVTLSLAALCVACDMNTPHSTAPETPPPEVAAAEEEQPNKAERKTARDERKAAKEEKQAAREKPGDTADLVKRLQENLDLSDEQLAQIQEAQAGGGTRNEIRATLTDEQRIQLKEHRAQMKEQRAQKADQTLESASGTDVTPTPDQG